MVLFGLFTFIDRYSTLKVARGKTILNRILLYLLSIITDLILGFLSLFASPFYFAYFIYYLIFEPQKILEINKK
jgi:hypothetical protein